MNEDTLQWINQIHPRGFYCLDLTRIPVSEVHWESVVNLNAPLLLEVRQTQLQEALTRLIGNGMPASTRCTIRDPAAGTESQITGTLGDIALRTRDRSEMYLLIEPDIRETGRLKDVRVVVTRSKSQAGDLTRLLEAEAALVFEIPAIEIVLYSEQILQMRNALDRIAEYSWLLLTSVNTVDILNQLLQDSGRDWTHFSGLQIGCIGASTAGKVRELGGTVALVPPRFQAESFAEELAKFDLREKQVLLPRAAGSRQILPEELSRCGAGVHEIHIYRAESAGAGRERLKTILEQAPDFITFTSSSTVRNFAELAGDLPWRKIKAACIGPITATTLREFEVEPVVEAREFTISGLVQALCESVDAQKNK